MGKNNKNVKKNNLKNNNIKELNRLKKLENEQKQKQLQKEQQIQLERDNIRANTLKVINQLKKNNKKFSFHIKRKLEAKRQINELSKLIEDNEYDILREKLIGLKELYDEETIELNVIKNSENKKQKTTFKQKWVKTINFLKTARYPIYTRVKKIINENEGKQRIKKLSIVALIVFLLLSIMIVGILIFSNTININSPSIDNTLNSIIATLILGVPFALLFVI